MTLLGLPILVQAQSKIVTGAVEAGDGMGALPGVTVLIKGTSTGTVTDLDGKFSLDVSNVEDPTLTFSFIGYITKTVAVGKRTVIDVTLEPDITALEEVVVIGYGVQKKKVVTAATANVLGDALEKRLSTTALQGLQGQAAGVTIRSTSGQPGAGMKVNIRGLGTTGDGNGPLYIVDGVQTGDIKYLNPSDIESIDVLKDAASAAIYGSRAANGVVLITTKRGRAGKSQITFDGFYGVQSRTKEAELLNAKEYAQIMNEQHLNSGGTASSLPFDVNNLPAYTEEGSADNKWLDEMFEDNAVTQNYTLGLTGGTEDAIYSASMSYTGQDGIVGGSELSSYERLGGRINSEYKFYNGFLKIGENLTVSSVKRQGVEVGSLYNNTLRGAFNTSPLLPMYDDNGKYFNTADKTVFDQFGDNYYNDGEANPYASMELGNQNLTNEFKIVGNAYAEIEPIKRLKIRSSFGFDIYSEEYRKFVPEYALSIYSFNTTSDVEQSMRRNTAYQFDNYATYDFSFGEHYFTTMVGTSYRNYKGRWLKGKNSTLVFDDFDHAWLNNATNQQYPELGAEGAPDDEDRLRSYFGRVQYNFKEKYLLNATIRADGSSKFAEGNQWGYFPSVSAGWVISEETFLIDNSVLDFAKLRVSWGQNGNQNIDAFQFVGPIKFTQAQYAFGNTEGVSTPGSYQNRLSNPDVRWETSEQINVGTDLRFFQSKLTATFDWYKKTTKDWLVEAPVLATAGADAPFINGGSVENTGFEWELSFKDMVGDFQYSLGINGAYNKNIVGEIPSEDGVIHGDANILFANSKEFYRAENGHPIGYFWGLETDGIFQNNSEVDAHQTSDGKLIQPNAKPGDVRYIDRNDDGILNDGDKIGLGNPNPPLTFGFNFSANYKAFDFSVVCYGVYGNQIVQSYRSQGNRYANYTTAVLDRWAGEGTSNTLPRVTNSNTNYSEFSSLFIQDGDYLRVGNITLGYDFANMIGSEYISQMRVYAAVNNLYTFTKYDGMDPDVGFGPQSYSSGVDLGFYPNPRTMIVGVNIKF